MREFVNLTQEFDARVWTEEWLKTIKDHPDIPTDKGTMLAWFSNALMAGYDHYRWKYEKELKIDMNPISIVRKLYVLDHMDKKCFIRLLQMYGFKNQLELCEFVDAADEARDRYAITPSVDME